MLTLKNKRKIRLCNFTSESVELGILLAIVGGFLDAYTFVGRGGVFANAQTGNVVLMGIEAAKGEWDRQYFMLFSYSGIYGRSSSSRRITSILNAPVDTESKRQL